VAELLRVRTDRYPAVVVEDNRNVLGFAWTSEYRPRAAYAGVAEFAIYVTPSARGQGVGRLALGELINEAERRRFTKLVSRIFPENVASRGLCAALGFREVGVYRRHGQLDGRWMDCVIVERLLGAAARD
jgi:phosphinothricin acetyltransferase